MSTPATQLSSSGSNLPTIQRLFADDFKNAPTWFSTDFIETMNLFLQPVYNILNQGIDVTLNTREEFYKFSIVSAGVPATDTFSFTPRKFGGQPNGVIVCQCFDASAALPAPVGNPVTIDWYFTGTQVKILAIYGLTVGHTYNFTLRIC